MTAPSGRFWLALVLSAFAFAACDSTPSATADRNATKPAAAIAPTSGQVELIEAPESAEPIEDVVKRERSRAMSRGRELVVYVGAAWCEPCQRFHHAAEEGKLNADFPKLTLLDFDHDRDEARLRAAGYTSKLIPLFAKPGEDGKSSGKQIEGSIKGDGAVGEITPRLRALIEASR